MKCEHRDTDLLMLLHGEAKGLSKLGTRFHLLYCRRCRERLDGFYAVSQTLAANLENPRLGVQQIVRPSVTTLIAVILVILFLTGATASFVGTWIGGSTGSSNCQPLANNTPPNPSLRKKELKLIQPFRPK